MPGASAPTDVLTERAPRTRPAQRLRWLHLTAGALGIVAFLETGQFMDGTLNHLVGMPDAPRALYRSAHIYILFAALLHLGLAAYVVTLPGRLPRLVQYAGSAILLAALACFVYGFYVETPPGIIERPVIRTGIELSLAGILLHVAAAFAAAQSQRQKR